MTLIVEGPSSFEVVFGRLTAGELVAVCDAYGLLNAISFVPAELSADGALSWMAWKNGQGQYYDSANPEWTPASLLDVTLWLDAQDLSRIYSDTGATTVQNSDGGSIAYWTNQIAANGMTQSNATYRPTLALNAHNGRHAIRCDNGTASYNLEGDSRFLVSTVGLTSIVKLDKPFTIFAVVKQRVAGNQNFVVLGDNAGNIYMGLVGTGAGTLGKDAQGYIRPTTTTNVKTTAGVIDNVNPFIVTWQYAPGNFADGLGERIYLNGVLGEEKDATGNLVHSGSFYLATDDRTNAYKIEADYFEVIVASGDDADYDVATRDKVGKYLAHKHGAPYQGRDYTYRGNVFASSRRAHDVRDYLKARYVEAPAGFIEKAVGTDTARARELAGVTLPASPLTSGPTQIAFWDKTAYDTLTSAFTLIDSRSNLIFPVQANFGNNSTADNTFDPADYVTKLLAKPAGRRWITISGYKPLYAIPVADGGSYRYAMYDREFDITVKRRGLSLENWWSQISASSSTSKWRSFWEQLRSNGGTSIVDGLILDIERVQNFYQLKNGEGYTSFDPTVGATNSSFFYFAVTDLTNDVCESRDGTGAAVTHGILSAGEPVVVSSTTTLPAPLTGATIYYAKPDATTPATKFTLHTATPPTTGNRVDLSSTGTGTHRVMRETWTHLFGDTNWNGSHGSLPRGVRGAISPNLTQSIWNTYTSIDPNASEIAFLYDAWTRQYYTDFVVRLVDIARESFPKLIATDYGSGVVAPGTFSSDLPSVNFNSPYGVNAGPVRQAMNFYGDWLGNRWNWNTQSNQSYSGTSDQNKFAAFTTQIMRLRSVLAASRVELQPWLASEGISQSSMGTAGLWAETVLHFALISKLVNFYQTGVSAAEQKRLVDLVAERDAVVGYSAKFEAGPPVPNYNPGIIWTRALAGNRWIWRVTPNPTATSFVLDETAEGVRFENSISWLFINGGIKHPLSTSTLAPLGYWIEQPVESSTSTGQMPFFG